MNRAAATGCDDDARANRRKKSSWPRRSLCLSRWTRSPAIIDDGRLEIDNNAAERAIARLALGRKNYLFAGSDAGGERAAVLYTLIETAKLNGLDPEAYPARRPARIADHPINRIDELLPWAVAEALKPELPLAA